VRQIAKDINLISLVIDKLSLTLSTMQSLKTTEKNGVQKVSLAIIEKFCF
jgi:hypothetical protein